MNVTRRSPPKRDRGTIVLLIILFLIILLTIEWYFQGFPVTVRILTKCSCNAIIPFIVLRFSTFFPEVIHQIQFKKYNILHAIQRSIKNNASWNYENTLYLILTFAMYFGNTNPDRSLENKHLGSQKTEDVNKCGVVEDLIFYTLMAYYMFRDMGEYPTKKALSIEKEWSSMASGFYYGYLKIILHTLSERIELYKCKENVGEHFKVNKLLVLIPSSTVIFDQVKNVCSEFIQEVGQIEYNCSRAYVENRSYKNTIYRVQDPKSREIYYTVFEGATPIKTFYEQCKEDPTLMDYRRETVYAFYITLKTILDNDPNIKDFVELVYYEDDEKPGHGTEQSGLLNIILDRLKEIIRKQEIANINMRM